LTGLSDVRALCFDAFGTTVDWRSGVAAEAQRLGALNGVDGDWDRLADAWRGLLDGQGAARGADSRGREG